MCLRACGRARARVCACACVCTWAGGACDLTDCALIASVFQLESSGFIIVALSYAPVCS